MIERMRELISEQLNCDAEMITPDTSFKDDWVPIPWIYLNW